MKRSCKHIDITNPETVRPWVYDCLSRHWRRHDFRRLLIAHGISHDMYVKAVKTNDKGIVMGVLDSICLEACRIIKERDFDLPRISIRIRRDHTTGKERQIGRECPMQQILDYIAVRSCQEIWDRRMSTHQMSSIPGRGQILGMQMLKRFVKRDNRAMAYSRSHSIRYGPKSRWKAKLDIEKCFPSSKAETFISLLRRDCANDDIVWLWMRILMSHRVDGYRGFMIGALSSQWASQYLISFIFRYAMGLRFRGRKAVSQMVLFMDDMVLYGSSRSRLKRAVKSVIVFARTRLGYSIKKNWHITDMDDCPLDMMGFVLHRDGKVTIRARNYIHSRRIALRAERSGWLSYRQAVRLLSYKGFYKYSDTRRAAQVLRLDHWFSLGQRVIGRHDRRVYAA